MRTIRSKETMEDQRSFRNQAMKILQVYLYTVAYSVVKHLKIYLYTLTFIFRRNGR